MRKLIAATSMVALTAAITQAPTTAQADSNVLRGAAWVLGAAAVGSAISNSNSGGYYYQPQGYYTSSYYYYPSAGYSYPSYGYAAYPSYYYAPAPRPVYYRGSYGYRY